MICLRIKACQGRNKKEIPFRDQPTNPHFFPEFPVIDSGFIHSFLHSFNRSVYFFIHSVIYSVVPFVSNDVHSLRSIDFGVRNLPTHELPFLSFSRYSTPVNLCLIPLRRLRELTWLRRDLTELNTQLCWVGISIFQWALFLVYFSYICYVVFVCICYIQRSPNFYTFNPFI